MVVGRGWEGIVRYEIDDMEVKRELEWQIDDIVTIAVYQVVFFCVYVFQGSDMLQSARSKLELVRVAKICMSDIYGRNARKRSLQCQLLQLPHSEIGDQDLVTNVSNSMKTFDVPIFPSSNSPYL